MTRVVLEIPNFATMSDDEVAAHRSSRLHDGCWSWQTRALLEKFETKLLDLNDNWARTSTLWRCPICRREKPSIVRLSPQRVLLCQLDQHHDHLRDDIERSLKALRSNENDDETHRRNGARLSVMDLCERFTPTIVCADCNHADGAAKAGIPTMDPRFSFSPDEIARFIEISPNQPHRVLIEKAQVLWDELRDDLVERLDFARRMASRIAKGKHDKESHRALIRAGVYRDLFLVADLVSDAVGPDVHPLELCSLLSTRSRWTDGNASAIKAPRTQPVAIPTQANLEAFTAKARPGPWTRAGDEWCCQICARSKFGVLRKSNKGDWTGGIHKVYNYMSARDQRSIYLRSELADDVLIFGSHEDLSICQDCRSILTEAQRITPGTSEYALRPEDLKVLAGSPVPHRPHLLNRSNIREMVEANVEWANAAKSYWQHAVAARSAWRSLDKLTTYPEGMRDAIRDEIFMRWHLNQPLSHPNDRSRWEWLVTEGQRLSPLLDRIKDM